MLYYSKAIFFYRDDGNSNYGTACVLSISGTTITAGTPVVFESASSAYFSVAMLDSSKAIVCYRDGGNSGYGTACVVSRTLPPTVNYILKLTGTLWGYALTGGTTTAAVSVGPFVEGLAGLVTGNTYYVGWPTGIASSGALECGRAVSTTTLLLKKQY